MAGMDNSLSEEQVEDIVGAMAEAGYGLSYDDAQGLLSKTREGPNPYDVAKTWAESDLTLTHTGTKVASGSVSLGTTPTGNTTSRSPDGDTTSGVRSGLRINPNKDLAGVKATVSNNTTAGAENAYITDSNGNVIASGSVENGVAKVVTPLTSGNTYHFVIDSSDGSGFTAGVDYNAVHPYTGEDLDLTAGVTGENPDVLTGNSYCLNDVEGLLEATTGSVIPEWPDDRAVADWDTLTFQVTEDGATIDTYVQYNDGSGWTRANGGNPISRNYSLADDPAISPSDNVRPEFVLSRPDATYNPTVDNAYLSWFV